MIAEIYPADFSVRAELAGGPRAKYTAALKNVGSGSYGQRFPDVMVSHQNADSGAAEVGDDLLNIHNGQRIDS